MNLILITGMSGAGKSTFARYLSGKMKNILFLSLDEITETIYESVGFCAKDEKLKLREIGFNIMYHVLHKAIKANIDVLIDYCFGDGRKERLLEELKDQNINIVTVRINCKPEISYQRYRNRYDRKEHHIAHNSCRYPLVEEEDSKPWEYERYLNEVIDKRLDRFELGNTIVVDADDILNIDYDCVLSKIFDLVAVGDTGMYATWLR